MADSDLGAYTVKVMTSDKVPSGGGWRYTRVTLSPDSTDSSFQPVVFDAASAGGLRVIAVLVEVLG